MENIESPTTNPYRRNRLERRKDEYENLSEEQTDPGNSSLGTKSTGTQGWRNVRAVMAYYCTLRKIKRNGGVHVIYFHLKQKKTFSFFEVCLSVPYIYKLFCF